MLFKTINSIQNFIHLLALSPVVAEYNEFIAAKVEDALNECLAYDTKESDVEAPVMLELCGVRGTSLLPSLLGPIWSGVVAADKVLSMDKKKLNQIVWN